MKRKMVSKRGVSKVIATVLIISLILSAAVILWSTIRLTLKKSPGKQDADYFKETLGLQKAKEENKPSEVGEGGCVPDWECEEWSKCEVNYNLGELIKEKIFLEGEKERKCEDPSKCLPTKIEKEKCSTKANVNVKKITLCSKEYLEVRDEKGVLISRVELVKGDSEVLNIQFFLGEEDEIECDSY